LPAQGRPGPLGDFIGVANSHPPDSCSITGPVRAWAPWRNPLTAEPTRLGEPMHPEAPAFRPLTRHGQRGAPGRLGPHARLTGQSVALIVQSGAGIRAGRSLRRKTVILRRGQGAGLRLDAGSIVVWFFTLLVVSVDVVAQPSQQQGQLCNLVRVQSGPELLVEPGRGLIPVECFLAPLAELDQMDPAGRLGHGVE